MKRKSFFIGVLFLLAVVAVLAISVGAATAAEQKVRIIYNGYTVHFPDQQPFIDQATGRTYIPLRTVSETLGATVSWEDTTKTAIVVKNGKTIRMTVGSNTPTVNGSTITLDAPVIMRGDSVMVPVRFVSETLGSKIDWDGKNFFVTIHPSQADSQTPVVKEEYPKKLDRLLPEVKEKFVTIYKEFPGTEFSGDILGYDPDKKWPDEIVIYPSIGFCFSVDTHDRYWQEDGTIWVLQKVLLILLEDKELVDKIIYTQQNLVNGKIYIDWPGGVYSVQRDPAGWAINIYQDR